MDRPSLDRLLRPSSIAVVGGGTWCANVIEQCHKIGFTGEIWPVHPARDHVGGVSAFRAVEDLPTAPDAAFVGINRHDTIKAVRELSQLGAGGAVCFASGFREALAETDDGATLQAALLDAAGEMTVLGPNCYGFLNYLDGAALWPDQHGGLRSEGGVAIVTQSSNIAINLTMQKRGLPLAYVVTVGNQAQTGVSAVVSAFLDDPRVTAIGLHIEGIDDLREFERMAQKARSRGVPLVALKIGQSDQARAATVSHTASLAGSDTGAQALLERLGIGRVTSLSTLLEVLKLLHVCGPLQSNRIASLSCSGGEASLMADMAYDSGLVFPALEAKQKDALRDALGPSVALANPLDYHTYIWGDVDAMRDTFAAMAQGNLAMVCVVLDLPRNDRCDASAWEPVISAVDQARAATGKPMAILASLQETLPEAVALRLIDIGIVPFSGMETAISAMKVAACLGEKSEIASELLRPPVIGNSRILNEAEAKAALSVEGLRIPVSTKAHSVEAAGEAAAHIGFPVALKVEGIAHKTEVGAVALDLPDVEAVATAARQMPGDRFLIEEMIIDTVAELLVGVIADPAHGYVLTLAAGGTLTELVDDSASLLVPAPRESVCEALQSLRIARLLNGYRGAPIADLEAILDAVMAVQSYVAKALPLEIEINPLLCGTNHATAADALIRIGDSG